MGKETYKSTFGGFYMFIKQFVGMYVEALRLDLGAFKCLTNKMIRHEITKSTKQRLSNLMCTGLCEITEKFDFSI